MSRRLTAEEKAKRAEEKAKRAEERAKKAKERAKKNEEKAKRAKARAQKQISRQVKRGFKYNKRTLRKAERLISSPSSALRPFEIEYLEQFTTQEKALKKARSFVVNPSTVISVSKGLMYSQAKESAVKHVMDLTAFTEDEANLLVESVAGVMTPSAFLKEGTAAIAKYVVKAVGLGNLEGTALDVASDIIGTIGSNFVKTKKKTKTKSKTKRTKKDVSREMNQPTTLSDYVPQEMTAEGTLFPDTILDEEEGYYENQETATEPIDYNEKMTEGVEGFDDEYDGGTYERDLTSEEVIDLYIEEVQEYTTVQLWEFADDFLDTTSDVQKVIDKLNSYKGDPEKADSFVKRHPYSWFRKQIEEATYVPDSKHGRTDEERIQEIHEEFDNFVAWL